MLHKYNVYVFVKYKYEYLKAEHIETKTITKKYLFGLITITKTYTVNAYTSLYIEGDFSEALELAKEYQETGYGEYKVLSHNCLHYAQDLLKNGQCTSDTMQKAISHTYGIVPALYIPNLLSYRVRSIRTHRYPQFPSAIRHY